MSFLKIITATAMIICSGCATKLTGKLSVNNTDNFQIKDGSANLTLLSNAKAESFVTSITENGEFEFDQSLNKGRYLLEVLAPGYEIYSTEIEIIESSKLQVNLIPQKSISLSPIKFDAKLDSSRGVGEASLTPPKL